NTRNRAPWVEDRTTVRRERYNLSDPYERDLYMRETGRDPYTGRPLIDEREVLVYPENGDAYPLTEEGQDYRESGIERRPLDEGYANPPQTASTTPNEPAEIVPVAPAPSRKSSEDIAKLQVLLDRAGASPGVIDGHDGSNVRKALLAYEELTGETLPIGNGAALDAALAATGGPAFMDYTITAEDVAAPMVASVPDDYGEKAKLDHLSFTSVTEMFGERFHMDENYLKALNPEANFNRVGTIIRVANVGQNVSAQVDRIVADKGRKQVRAYDAQGKLVAAYPTTIGSGDTPSPTGTHKVARIAFDPEYTYNPKLNFKQGSNDKVLRIPPGPNGPVGTIWIALDKPTYGIHGTPEPSKIGKTESHGCVRLTNWDAAELAKIVKPGIFVQFIE
ncbi:MAG TPA: L,D-transpeptidase, partial [Tianweitania sediminis]|nr:L,D-transpeptidase [Tianweitania sediminis]